MDFRLSDEFRAPRRPQLIVALNITHAKVEKVADDMGIAWWRGDDFRLVIGTAASTVDYQPDVGEPKKRWLALAQKSESIASASLLPPDKRRPASRPAPNVLP